MTKVKIWLTENKSIVFGEEKTFEEVISDIFKKKVFVLIKKDKISLAVNVENIILVEELK